MQNCVCGRSFASDPTGELTALPRLRRWISGDYRGDEDREGKGKGGKKKEKKKGGSKEGEAKLAKFWLCA